LDWFGINEMSMAGDNSALRRRALAALILAESQRDGGYHGTRLPTERQLALDLGVSRSAIRHAMALLQAEGHVSREVGRGTFLRDAPDEAPADAADATAEEALATPEAAAAETSTADASGADDYAPADVMTVRRLFEPTAMSLVVAWATARDFEEMDRCLRGGERAADHEEFEVWDAALHRSIIAATRSPLLIRLYAEIERARHGRVWGDLKRRSATAARRDEYRRDHEEIVTALRLRDADQATAAMRTHLARVSRHLLGTELSLLGEGQDVPVRIGEPGHPRARRGRPDAVLVLAHALVAEEGDPARGEVPHRGHDVGGTPAEHGVAAAVDLAHRRHAQHGAVSVQHAGEIVLLEDGQAERLLVERPRPAQVGGGHEGHQVTRLQHGVSSDQRLRPLRS
jgi:GntR family transcriptional regulator, uxu operon transcriptional repressor